MLLKEFYELLQKSKRTFKWCFENKSLRAYKKKGGTACYCPITVVNDLKNKTFCGIHSAEYLTNDLKMSNKTLAKLISAADFSLDLLTKHEKQTRKKLLEVLNLTEGK